MGLAALILGEHINAPKIFSGAVLLVCQPYLLFPSNSSAGQENTSLDIFRVGLAIAACVSGSFRPIFVNMMKSEVGKTKLSLNRHLMF